MESLEFINSLFNGGVETQTIFIVYILINLFFRLKGDTDKKLEKLLSLSENINSDMSITCRLCKPENVLTNLDSILKKLEKQPITEKDVSTIETALKENNDKLIEIKSILLNRWE